MWYDIIREDKKFTITNIWTSTIYLTLLKGNPCDIEENYEICIGEIQIAPGNNHTFNLSTDDGLYKLLLTDKIDRSEQIPIPQYDVLLSSLIEDIEYILCGCLCADCGDGNCDGEDEDLLTTLLKLLSYLILINPKYYNTLKNTAKCIECEILDANMCIIMNENVRGNISNKRLLKKIVAYYYLVLFYTDYISEGETDTVKSTYHFNDIYPCIKKLGLNIDCIKANAEISPCKECGECTESSSFTINSDLFTGLQGSINTNLAQYYRVYAKSLQEGLKVSVEDRTGEILAQAVCPLGTGTIHMATGFYLGVSSTVYPAVLLTDPVLSWNEDSQSNFGLDINAVIGDVFRGSSGNIDYYSTRTVCTGLMSIEITTLLESETKILLGEIEYGTQPKPYPPEISIGITGGVSEPIVSITYPLKN